MSRSDEMAAWPPTRKASPLDSRSDSGRTFERQLREIESGVAALNLNPDVVHLAVEIAAFEAILDDEQRIGLVLLILVTLAAIGEGSTRFPVVGAGSIAPMQRLLGPMCGESSGSDGVERMRIVIERLLARNAAPAVIGTGPDDYKPLVFLSPFIYQHRVLTAEMALAHRLTSLLNTQSGQSDSALMRDISLKAISQSVAKAGKYHLSEEQLHAIECAVTTPLTIISGGPGTGKTSIVLSLLLVLMDAGVDPGAIALAAPTGKAAYRIGESLRAGLMGDASELKRFPEPTTVHRMLGYSPERRRFRYHAGNPLNAEVVIVDEGSMLDLELMSHLLDALRSGARLVILGDADQLPSVSAGAVFRDLVCSGDDAPALAKNCVRLTRSYRVDLEGSAGKAIFDLANAINLNDRNPLHDDHAILVRRESASEVAFEGAEWLDEEPTSAAFLERWYAEKICGAGNLEELRERVFRVDEGNFPPSECEALRQVFEQVSKSRILCHTRVLDSGSERLNWTMHRRVAHAREVSPDRQRFIAGEPVMMLRNDYGRSLFNGDQGVVLQVQRGDDEPALMAVFARAENFVAFPIDSLREHLELCYAITVHKAQGSEFDSVAVILPEKDVPILSREILYTAVSRARKSVVIVGARALLEAGLSRRIERYSGVREHLAQFLRESRRE